MEVEDERENVYAKGARCVSLSSVIRFQRSVKARKIQLLTCLLERKLLRLGWIARTLGEFPRHDGKVSVGETMTGNGTGISEGGGK